MGMRRRPLARAAVVGGVAYHAGKKGAQNAAAEQAQNQQIADLQAQQAQQQYAPPPQQYAPPPPRRPPAAGSDDMVAQLDQPEEAARRGHPHAGGIRHAEAEAARRRVS